MPAMRQFAVAPGAGCMAEIASCHKDGLAAAMPAGAGKLQPTLVHQASSMACCCGALLQSSSARQTASAMSELTIVVC